MQLPQVNTEDFELLTSLYLFEKWIHLHVIKIILSVEINEYIKLCLLQVSIY